MRSSVAKIIAAAFALTAPFIAGLLIADGLPPLAAFIVLAVGLGVGFVGLATFCSIDTQDEIAHLRRLHPELRLGGEA